MSERWFGGISVRRKEMKSLQLRPEWLNTARASRILVKSAARLDGFLLFSPMILRAFHKSSAVPQWGAVIAITVGDAQSGLPFQQAQTAPEYAQP